ncbi:hypothetical protein E1A91_A12G204500v1 [Gossypium mustelinum]|uniref:Uncharacterized protein n=1 Tax=Gossypium mustelinum TaxID=34275 RepID=A0A5D2WW87_GOSMU|nr:hypothetical protein E1A91_A12G204500v1 [Gossypium mustelinum]
MKFSLLPHSPLCLPAEKATNGSPNRRRDSGAVRSWRRREHGRATRELVR